ncbi:Virion core protein [Eptesipox virus]|uniref:Virion core protein n=1 Tax=Eptesipox virus TaxID=1329402 RepID=A0A220T6F4_9POXV|nr:Virion core protein [Eptesipox virus]ASK51286.1 Virion core protein [Eptesipox virus]WAH71044.1 virion core protein [Eptesipox virus]
MDNEIIYIDNYSYPIIKKNNNVIYLCFINNDFFINNIIQSLSKHKTFFAEYEIYPNNKGTLYLKQINSSRKINNRFLNIEEFIQTNYSIYYLNNNINITFLKNVDKIIITDILYLDESIWKRLTIIQCPTIVDTTYENYLINPFLLLDKNEIIFKNIMLLSSINSLFHNKNSSFKMLLNEIIKSHKVNMINVFINNKNKYDNKYINYNYNRNTFKAFIHAWFSNQLSSDNKENEKVEKVFQSLNNTI